jgi:hypothetical protein
VRGPSAAGFQDRRQRSLFRKTFWILSCKFFAKNRKEFTESNIEISQCAHELQIWEGVASVDYIKWNQTCLSSPRCKLVQELGPYFLSPYISHRCKVALNYLDSQNRLEMQRIVWRPSCLHVCFSKIFVWNLRLNSSSEIVKCIDTRRLIVNKSIHLTPP